MTSSWRLRLALALLSVAGLAGCGEDRLDLIVDAERGLVVAVSEERSELSSAYFEVGEAVTLAGVGAEPLIFVFPDEAFVSVDGAPTTLEDVRVYRTGRIAEEGECGFCASVREEAPFIASPGSDCAPPPGLPVYRGADRLDETEAMGVRGVIRLSWPGTCPCDAEDEPPRRGPLRPVEGDWPVHSALATGPDSILMVGQRLVRTSSAGSFSDGPTSVGDACSAEADALAGLDMDLDAVFPLGDGRAVVVGDFPSVGPKFASLDLQSLEVSSLGGISNPQTRMFGGIAINGEVALFGTGRVGDFSSALVFACRVGPTFLDCEPVVSASGIRRRIDFLHPLGDGVALGMRFFVSVVSRWPRADEFGSFSDISDRNDTIALAGGGTIPTWTYQSDVDFPGVILHSATLGTQLTFCVDPPNGASGTQLFSLSVAPGQQSRPALVEGTRCENLACVGMTQAFGSTLLMGRGQDNMVRLLPVDPAGRVVPDCAGGTPVPGMSSPVRTDGYSDRLVVVDSRRQIVRWLGLEDEPEWIVRRERADARSIDVIDDVPFVYRTDGSVERLTEFALVSVTRLDLRGELIDAARSPSGRILYVDRVEAGDEAVLVELDGSDPNVVARWDLGDDVRSRDVEIRWLGDRRAVVRRANQLLTLDTDVIKLGSQQGQNAAHEDLVAFTPHAIAADPNGLLMVGLDKAIDLLDAWSDRPRLAGLVLKNEDGSAEIPPNERADTHLVGVGAECPGKLLAVDIDGLLFGLHLGEPGAAWQSTRGLLLSGGLNLSAFSVAAGGPEGAFVASSAGPGGPGRVVDASGAFLGLDVVQDQIVGTPDALWMRGDDGRVYVDAPCP